VRLVAVTRAAVAGVVTLDDPGHVLVMPGALWLARLLS